jgi:hypothetical protein
LFIIAFTDEWPHPVALDGKTGRGLGYNFAIKRDRSVFFVQVILGPAFGYFANTGNPRQGNPFQQQFIDQRFIFIANAALFGVFNTLSSACFA